MPIYDKTELARRAKELSVTGTISRRVPAALAQSTAGRIIFEDPE